MKKMALFLFTAIAVIAFGAGTARADRGFWFHSTSGGWSTYFNITNTSASAVAATVTFYALGGGTAIGSTTQTIQPNGQWNFSTGAIGNITTGSLEASVRGPVTISGATTDTIHGYSTIANSTFSGFNFGILAGTGPAAE